MEGKFPNRAEAGRRLAESLSAYRGRAAETRRGENCGRGARGRARIVSGAWLRSMK